MVKKPVINFQGVQPVSYLLAHPEIPIPQVGFHPDWKEMHSHISGLLPDHEDCPAIKVREQIGITLSMPYTCRFYRDGHIEVETFWEKNRDSVFTVRPTQTQVALPPKGEKFPGFHVQLPSSDELAFPLHLFVLGDIRVNAWIIQSGVMLVGVPDDLTLLIAPLPNHSYPAGYSVGQALVYSASSIGGNLKIPIDLDFSKLPDEQDFIAIAQGTPMVQYIPVRLSKIEFKKNYSKR